MNESIIEINVSELPAPEPLNRVLELLKVSKNDVVVCMVHRIKPCVLFDILAERGYASKITEVQNQFMIYIWHTSNDAALEIIEKDINRVR